MSKPLVFVLQVTGLVLIFNGATSDPTRPDLVILGVLIAVVAGWSLRKRFSRGG